MSLKTKLISLTLSLGLLCTPMAALADTIYEVPVSMHKIDNPKKPSIANAALNPTAKVSVGQKESTYTVEFKPIQMQGLTGQLTKLFVYKDGKKTELPVKSVQNGDYNAAYSFTFHGQKAHKAKIAVWVDAMDQIMGGTPGAGEQDALLMFDWAKARAKGGENPVEKPNGIKSKPQGNEPIQVFVKGKKLNFDSQPVIVGSGRTMVPMRAIFESLGATVKWDNATRGVSSEKDGRQISLTIDQRKASINGAVKDLDEPPMIQNGRTLVPLRFVGEAFGNKVDYHKAGNIAVIDIY